jgi:hypothetical protein
MENSESTDPSDPIYQDIRRIVGRDASPSRQGNWLLRILHSVRRRVNDMLAALLLGRSALLAAALLAAALPLSMAFTAGERNSAAIADASRAPAVPPQRQFKIVYERAPVTETYVVRAGSFRSPANAERVADFVRKQDLNATIRVQDNALVVVTVGPFFEKTQADEAARLLHESMHLNPQVVPSPPDFP